MKFPFAFLFIYLSTNYVDMDKSQIPSQISPSQCRKNLLLLLLLLSSPSYKSYFYPVG